jgi:hypothetical protein
VARRSPETGADKAPCLPHIDFDRVYARTGRLAAAQGFEEVPDPQELRGLCQRVYARWGKLRRRVAPCSMRPPRVRVAARRPRLADFQEIAL